MISSDTLASVTLFKTSSTATLMRSEGRLPRRVLVVHSPVQNQSAHRLHLADPCLHGLGRLPAMGSHVVATVGSGPRCRCTARRLRETIHDSVLPHHGKKIKNCRPQAKGKRQHTTRVRAGNVKGSPMTATTTWLRLPFQDKRNNIT